MAITTQRLQYLLTQYAGNNCTRHELLELLQIIEQGKNDAGLQTAMDALWADLGPQDTLPAINKEKIFSNIIKPATVVPLHRRAWFRLSAAAAIIFLLAVAYLFVNQQQGQSQIASTQGVKFKNDVPPGTNKAVLTLANGLKIVLNDAKNGTIASQGKVNIVKLDSGRLVYAASNSNVTSLAYNTVTTPRGGKYNLKLADGTQVWLNASSSITYPTVFTGNERNVTITGEAYFEVAKNKHMPFHVKAGDQTIEVLGTHFNVNAYADEDKIRTTLLEGKVNVSNSATNAILLPGQQSIADPNSKSIVVKVADTEQAVAWKNGYFQFERSDIQSVMRQLSRWYDVDIKFEGKATQDKFGGSIPRDAPLSQVLRTLEQSMVHFKIDGKTLTVTE